jgi:hypothetical protein
MKQRSILIFICLFLFNVGYGQKEKETPSFDEIYQRKIPAWFNEAKFGIFVVWGSIQFPDGLQKVNMQNGKVNE